jgi:DNA-binding transcriptional MerR regulator
MSQFESEGIEFGNGHAADVIPGKELFRIGEVSRLTSTKQFVLRYWETEFPMLQPVKSPKGHRLYRREDVQTVLEIRRLLYDEGFTIAGARRHLREQNGGAESASAAPTYESGAHHAEQEASGKAGAAEHAHTARPVSAGGGAAAAPARAPIAAQPAASRATQPTISRQVLLDLQDSLRELLTLLKSE